jgi:hypothetical protein
MEDTGEAVADHEFRPQIGCLGLQFLDTDQVGLLPWRPIKKALVGGGADAIEIGRYNAHD